jgi:hypothetical protein
VVVLISYVDNRTIIAQSDMWDKNLVKLKSAYRIIFGLTQSMGLVLEHSKSEVVGMPPIHLHVKKLVERSHVCSHVLQATHTFHWLVDGDHKFSVETLKGQIHGDLKSPITEAW